MHGSTSVLTLCSSHGQGRLPVPVPSRDPASSLACGWWPLRTFREFMAVPGAVPCARAHARRVVREWGGALAGLADSAELIVSELVTNGVVASGAVPGVPPVRLWLTSDRARMLIMVGDESPRPPRCVDADSDTETGRGLLLIGAASDRWGWYPVSEGGLAKVVWAELAVTCGDPAAPSAGSSPEPHARPAGQFALAVGVL